MNVIENSQPILNVVRCELCERRANLIHAGANGWDWFTGKLRMTVHYCPDHARSDERNRAYEKANGTGRTP